MQIFQFIILVYSLLLVRAEQFLCKKEFHESIFIEKGNENEVLAIWSPVQAAPNSVQNLCAAQTGLPIKRQCSAEHQQWDVLDRRMELLDCSLIDNYCVEHSFRHFYIKRNRVLQRHTNKWPAATMGQVARSDDPCLLETGLPLTRKCIYNAQHYVIEWEKGDFENIKCLRDIYQEIVTYDLNDLYKEVRGDPGLQAINGSDVAARLTGLLGQVEKLRIPADLVLSTNILQLITAADKDPSLPAKVIDITNLLMQSNEGVVLSSSALDTPTTLLQTVETYYDDMANVLVPTSKCTNVTDGVEYYSQNLTSLFYINPACSNISGIAVYNTSAQQSLAMHYDKPTNTYFRYLYLNQSLEEIMQEEHLEAAAYFPQTVWEKLRNKTNTEAMRITLYRNKNFFVDPKHSETTPDGVILKMSVPGYTDELPDYVPLIFHRSRTAEQAEPQCGYYELLANTWKSTGISDAQDQNATALCKTKRLTSFGGLLKLNNQTTKSVVKPMELTTVIRSTPDVISIVGCCLSLFGLMCIWLTALCCEQWRLKSSNMLLLNICLVLTLLEAYFLFINLPELRDSFINMNFQHCIAEGAFLQYVVLVLFLWLLIIALFQHCRYVNVMETQRPRQHIVKYMFAAWGLPLVPTGLVMYLDSDSYMPFAEKGESSNGICYPSGRSFYITVLLPILLIIVVNCCIFLYILCSIRRSLRTFRHSKERKDFAAQVRLSILLFVLLGISWVFGVWAQMIESRVLSFLFCLTSTLQGFILFIYIVAFDQSVRFSWFNSCFAKNYYTLERSSMTPMDTVVS